MIGLHNSYLTTPILQTSGNGNALRASTPPEPATRSMARQHIVRSVYTQCGSTLTAFTTICRQRWPDTLITRLASNQIINLNVKPFHIGGGSVTFQSARHLIAMPLVDGSIPTARRHNFYLRGRH